MRGAIAKKSTVEVLVLEGRWQVGPIVYGPGDYFCVPGGVTHGPERALTDVRILVISHGPFTPGPSLHPSPYPLPMRGEGPSV